MRAGELRHAITIEQVTQPRDSHGEIQAVWTPFCSAMASVQPLKGSRFFEAHASNTSLTHTVKLRYRPGIKNGMRIKYKNRLLQIDAVINVDELDKELQIMCTEITHA